MTYTIWRVCLTGAGRWALQSYELVKRHVDWPEAKVIKSNDPNLFAATDDWIPPLFTDDLEASDGPKPTHHVAGAHGAAGGRRVARGAAEVSMEER